MANAHRADAFSVLSSLNGTEDTGMGPFDALAPFACANRHRAPLSTCSVDMQDGLPFLFNSTGRPTFLCLNQKVGSTTWKLALLRTMPSEKFHSLEISPHSARGIAPGCESARRSSSIPRFMMVRNPYSRLLSGYLDKCVLQRNLCPGDVIAAANTSEIAGFAKLVDWHVLGNHIGHGFGDHFSPLHTHCGILDGYDYYLPVERMHLWYRPFVSALGLQSVVDRGWNVSTRWWNGHGRACFYMLPGRDCEGNPTSSASVEAMSGPASFHATGSDARLDEFYTPDLARKVTVWAKNDLIEFGYPEWEGRNGDAFLSGISRAAVAFAGQSEGPSQL